MFSQQEYGLQNFFVAGVNYKKTDAAIRGQFAVNNEEYAALLKEAADYGIREVFVISTCNRTEIYGLAADASMLTHLLCAHTAGTVELFHSLAYIKQGVPAVEHLFHVAAGLDSQILGDYEIVGQLKVAVKFAKENGCINVFTERLINTVLQASKDIKTNTQLSGGTVSVSFAAVQYIRNHYPDFEGRNVLLVGTGKIGRNTCKNLVDYLETRNITLVNRTEEKATQLAGEMKLKSGSLDQLQAHIDQASVILLATSSAEPVVLHSHLENSSPKLIIDLAVPANIEAAAASLPHVTVVNVDELSKIKDETLHNREAEIPKVKSIIARYLAEFNEWHEMRRHAPVLKAVKNKLQAIHNCHLYQSYTAQQNHLVVAHVANDEKIQKVVTGMARKLRMQNPGGCTFLEAINEYIATGTN